MKTILFLSIALTTATGFAVPISTQKVKAYSFQYKIPKSKNFAAQQVEFSISKQATTKELAYKAAASDCFKKLTNNQYPGEEKGLEIIDICANPKM